MVQKSLSTAATESDAAARPQLRLAARAESHPGGETAELAGGIQEAVQQFHGHWRGSLDAVKETLATLERDCASAIETQEAGVGALLETLVAHAAAEADAAAQQAHDEAQIKVVELQGALSISQTRIATLQSELEAERAAVKSIQAQLDTEVAARQRAETERDEARRSCEQQAATAEAQIAALRAEGEAQRAELALALQQLDSAIAERAKLMATFQMVQRALSLGAPANAVLPVQDFDASGTSATDSLPTQTPAGKSAAPESPAPAAAPVSDPRAELAGLNPEAVEDATRVLDQVEAMYQLDLNSGRPGVEVVDSLIGSLQYARDVFVARWSASCDAGTLFEYQVDLLLYTHAGSSFGRHLSIAAYQSRQQAERQKAETVKAES